ncbi:MAG: cytochrome P450 [Wenzhouxiangellaceae bacterium]
MREALRLWPIAWLFARSPLAQTSIGSETVGPGQQVIVCPYLAHRNRQVCENPDRFDPGRWSQPGAGKHYLPFGWGEHRCTAASLSVKFITNLLGVINQSYKLNYRFRAKVPCVGVALSPPCFELTLVRGS